MYSNYRNPSMKTHYVCLGGCGNVSDYPGTCPAEGCKNEGLPMAPCTCEDEQHADAGKKEDEEDMDGRVETM